MRIAVDKDCKRSRTGMIHQYPGCYTEEKTFKNKNTLVARTARGKLSHGDLELGGRFSLLCLAHHRTKW
jgi:hypothetical protein